MGGSEDDIEKQCVIDEDFHPWFALESPWDGRIAPPQLQYRPPRWLLSRTYNIRGVFYKWEFENLKPIRARREDYGDRPDPGQMDRTRPRIREL